jgi:hypothetical protein
MNCCDDHGNCHQGRDCPVRKDRQLCQWCRGLGYDTSGYRCTCQPDHFGDTLAWILGGLIAVMVLLMVVRSCIT